MDFRTVGRKLSNWGRWGPDDELGTLNLITPEHVAAAASLAASGRVFDLGYTLSSDGPQIGLGGRIDPVHLMSMTGQSSFPDGGGFADDFIFMPLQCATQWDGLAHVFYDEQCYNGVPASSITARGAEKLAIGPRRQSSDVVCSSTSLGCTGWPAFQATTESGPTISARRWNVKA